MKEETFNTNNHYFGMGIALGFPLGIPVALAMGNIAFGPLIGAVIGVILGFYLLGKNRMKSKKSDTRYLPIMLFLFLFAGALFSLVLVLFL